MKLIETTPFGYKFETSNGCTWTRQKLVWAKKSIEIKGWKNARNLYLPSEDDSEFFPDATYRVETTGNRSQEDPLFSSLPCRIKPGTKHILQIFDNDNMVESEVRIKNHFDWDHA
jgi:hypothetical protein